MVTGAGFNNGPATLCTAPLSVRRGCMFWGLAVTKKANKNREEARLRGCASGSAFFRDKQPSIRRRSCQRPAQTPGEIPDARASGRILPIPAQTLKRDFGNPETPHPGQIRIGSKSRFPGKIGIRVGAKSGDWENRDRGQIRGIFPIPAKSANRDSIRENPNSLTARTVIADCQRQARLVRFLVGVPGWEKRLIPSD